MITKFKTIKNLAVFQDFTWDNSVRDKGNTVVVCKPVNLIYGRNYSGKTTLSRIVRALELGSISDKYENPEFEVSILGSADATQGKLSSHGKKIRVFNEDFVRENLRFINNPDEGVTPFAILGGNTTLEEEIRELRNNLGVKDVGEETGFYQELKVAKLSANVAIQSYDTERNRLHQQLSYKATNNPDGIKYKSERFGEQNYTKPKLEADIEQVLSATFTAISDSDVTSKLRLLEEKAALDIPQLGKSTINIFDINERAKELIEKKIATSDKIEQLVKDSVLNRWAKQGRELHKDKLENCVFCGNDISADRWQELDSHFDEESEQIERNIDALIIEIDKAITATNNLMVIDKSVFYSKYHREIDRLILIRESVIEKITTELKYIRENLLKRRNDVLNPRAYTRTFKNEKRIEWCWKIFENFRTAANSYSKLLGRDQTEAKKLLRLREVSDFVKTIGYAEELKRIENLKKVSDAEGLKSREINNKISSHLSLIEAKERLMKDEEKGALKVNEYLNNFFGHDFLTLKALEDTDQLGGKKIRFEIIRGGKKAHHLSEGECSLLAFCYYMAKLDDIDTKGSKPIIWIDDPISSLDSNHIFFVYSLINSEIVSKQIFEQLFISTHNLDFLKYLKRIKLEKNKHEFFILAREHNRSYVRLMPSYLKDYTTEFNYLFEQIYQCANVNEVTDDNHHLFYNFGNNARKFLEALLFYKYPSRIDNQTGNANSKRLLKYFGEDHQATILTDRVNNELSHLEEIFDRGMIPIDIPEIKKVAQFILNRMSSRDSDQYEALLESIGIETLSE